MTIGNMAGKWEFDALLWVGVDSKVMFFFLHGKAGRDLAVS
jgi:hypothetical protein